MKLAAELEGSLREFVSAGAAELCENGGRLAPLSKLSWEVRGSDDKPLLHIWSEQYNLTRRVIAITDHSDARLVLAVERFGRSRPDRLEFVRIDFERSARELSREEFCERLKGVLASQFPDETVESYWLRVRRHLELGEFRSYGYFPGVEIQEAPPLVYFAGRFVPANRNGSCRLDGRLATRDSRGDAPIATTIRH